jgi:hypothetical protein
MRETSSRSSIHDFERGSRVRRHGRESLDDFQRAAQRRQRIAELVRQRGQKLVFAAIRFTQRVACQDAA